MSTEKKFFINDKNIFYISLGIGIAVLALVILLKYIPIAYRPNVYIAQYLPAVNAFINSIVAVLLLAGFYQIKYKKNKKLHQAFMLSAFILSALFLVSYVLKSLVLGDVKFGGDGIAKGIYFFILITHIFLAAIILPLILITLYHAGAGNFVKHKKLARITFPIWIYVAITGPIVYFFIAPYLPTY